MVSDLRDHPETADHAGIMLGTALIAAGHITTDDELRKFIEGFN